MYQATTETFNAGTLTSRNRATYQYGTDGIRYRAISESDTVLSLNAENWQLTTDTKYLIDAHNHTGYQQVLQESVTDANGNLIRKIVYTIGLDHISQTTFTPGGPAQGTTAVFHMDGHGSTRILTDLAGAILNIGGFAQIYHYTAYGEAINFQMANAGTQYLYSGEQFDARIGQQYLRARYYDQANGTFNRLDPFFGNQTDPQSFHKYRYTHGDPISHADPTGNFDGLIGLIGNMSARVQIAATDFAISSQILFYSSGPAIGTYLLWNSITDTLTGIKALSTGRDGDGQTLTAGGWLLALLAVSMELMPGETEDVFKSLVNYRGLIGFPTMYSGFRKVDGTVAMLRMDGKDYYGASGWIGRTQRSLLDIKDWLIEKGVRSNAITPTHAEGHVFAEALLETGSSVSKKAELFIDQTFCKPCGLNRGLLSYCQALGIEELVVNIRLADGSVLQGLYDLSKVD
jgi:RHS repeat-associated protein